MQPIRPALRRTGRLAAAALTLTVGFSSSAAFAQEPIRIGAYCLVGTRVTILGGAQLPDQSVLGAGSVLNKAHATTHTLYAGQPAVPVKTLSANAEYFQRKTGYID